MNKMIITKDSFNSLTHIESKGSESNLFSKNHDLLKFISKRHLKERENIVNNLDSIMHEEIAYPIYTLYDKSGFLGYAMHYYDRYKTFDKFILDETIPFEIRKKVAIKLCKLFEFFEENKFAYDDIHPGNILFQDDDIKLVDLDSGIFYSKGNRLEYDTRIRVEENRLTKLCLSILYQIHPFTIDYLLKKNKKELLKSLPNNLIGLYNQLLSDSYSHFSPLEQVSEINESIIEETKLILKKN